LRGGVGAEEHGQRAEVLRVRKLARRLLLAQQLALRLLDRHAPCNRASKSQQQEKKQTKNNKNKNNKNKNKNKKNKTTTTTRTTLAKWQNGKETATWYKNETHE
jgi:hypothetical protein